MQFLVSHLPCIAALMELSDATLMLCFAFMLVIVSEGKELKRDLPPCIYFLTLIFLVLGFHNILGLLFLLEGTMTRYPGSLSEACNTWLKNSVDLLLSCSPDPVWQGDPSLGEPAGLFQLLRAVPAELPAQRVVDPSGLTVKCQPGAPRRRRRPGGGRRCSCHSFPGLHVAVLTFILF